MSRYEELCSVDGLANLIYDTDYDSGRSCSESPLRVNDDCPVNEDDICKETCIKCIKAWLQEEVDGCQED